MAKSGCREREAASITARITTVKLFVSWSKPVSHRVALVLRDWLPQVIQQVEPWVSSEDIAKGTRGGAAITAELAGTRQGVICLTQHNVPEPWINFEAGALSNHASDSRVRTVLFDLQVSQVQGPLADFQHTDLSDKHQVRQLVDSINQSCEPPLKESQLDKAFEKYWPDLVAELNQIRTENAKSPAASMTRQRSTTELLEELLERVRSVEKDNQRILEELLGNVAGITSDAQRRAIYRPGDIDSHGAKYTATIGLGIGRFKKDTHGKIMTDKDGNVLVNFTGRKNVKIRKLDFIDLPLFTSYDDAKEWLANEHLAQEFISEDDVIPSDRPG